MAELLDEELLQKKNIQADNFKRAKAIYKIIIACIAFSILFGVVVGKAFSNSEIQGLFIALPIILAFILSPIGLLFIIRSRHQKELPLRQIFWYFITYIIFNFVTLGFIIALAYDIMKAFD